MSDTTIGTTKQLLEGALEETDDDDVSFKLRTALQLLVAIEDRQTAARDTLSDADIEAETRDTLRDLGYLE